MMTGIGAIEPSASSGAMAQFAPGADLRRRSMTRLSLTDKIYLYGDLNRIASSRRLGREAQRNMELIWLAGRLDKLLQRGR